MVNSKKSQFLIGKVELYQENFPQRAEKEKFKSQFLIGKVEHTAKQEQEKSKVEAETKSQFLLGKVERLQRTLQEFAEEKRVSIPYR